jgi:hypothetical protein
MNLIPALGFWQWCLLAAVPPAIVLLYFLKLKRQPLQVPSTYLWHKSIEDLHVNSIWQRLRKSLLLFLQLLLIAVAALALLRPGWAGSKLSGNRFIFLIDTSASMSSNDVEPTRLAEAKRRAGELIEQMAEGDVAMIVSFSDTAKVEQLFTDNRRELARSLEGVEPTNRTTQLGEALRVAAGQANPPRAFEVNDTQVAEPLPTTLYIFSDGQFPSIEGFSLGNLDPVYVPIGQEDAANLGITAFSTRRREDKKEELQAFARIENLGPEQLDAEVELLRDGELVDAQNVALEPHGGGGVAFDLGDVHSGVLTLRARPGGALTVDNQAWVAIDPPTPANVLLVTPGDEALELALKTESAAEMARVEFARPDILATKEYQNRAASGHWALVIYDQCRPEVMPQADTLFIGRLPPGSSWTAEAAETAPQIIDVDTAHPLMQLIDMGNVRFADFRPLKPPVGSTVLVDTNVGVLFAIGPREGFEDAVLGADIVGTDDKGEHYANTDWPLRLSFPVFVLNALSYFTGSAGAVSAASVQPGQSIVLRGAGSANELQVRAPSGKVYSIERDKTESFQFSQTDELGIYEVLERNQPARRFAVNLFDSAESDIDSRSEIQIGYSPIKGKASWEGARHELWKVLLLVALGVLCLEWYIYNRRIYL